MMEISLNEIDIKDFKQFLLLQKKEASKILSQAINKTLPGVRTDAVQEIYNILNLTKTAIRKYMTIKKYAKPTDMTGIFDVTSKPIPLIHYGARQTNKGVTVKVLRSSGSRSLIKHAFIATMKSGHKGVFWRKERFPGRVWPVGVPRKIPTWKEPPGKKYRLKIRELYGLRATDVLDHGTHMQVVLAKAGNRYDKNVAAAYNFWLSKQKGLFD
jgi:hypothetical protein